MPQMIISYSTFICANIPTAYIKIFLIYKTGHLATQPREKELLRVSFIKTGFFENN